jgi:hypothetical protein
VVLPKRGSLRRSAGGEIEHMKGEYDVLLASELGETHGLIIGRGEGKVGSNIADVSRHGSSLLAVAMDTKSWPLAPAYGTRHALH